MPAYWSRTSSIRNCPGSGSFDRTVVDLDKEGEGLHELAVASWSCRRWLQGIVIFGSGTDSTCCSATSHGQPGKLEVLVFGTGVF